MDAKKIKDITFRNIIILSVAFMLLMAAFLTTGAIEQTILQSVQVEDPSFTGDGYISLSIIYAVFSISNFLAPSVVSLLGVRTTMFVGSLVYFCFIAAFLFPSALLLYATSGVLGFIAASVWVANGIYFTRNCTKENIGRNLGIYWVILSMGMLLGNGYVYFQFQGRSHIDYDTRFLVISVLAGVSVVATITLFFLGPMPKNSKKLQEVIGEEFGKKPKQMSNIVSAFTGPFRLLKNKNMILLIPTSIYNGLEIALFTGIYPTAVGFTQGFGADAKKLVGFSGIIIGAGTLLGGLIFGVFGEKLVKSNRKIIVTIACLSHAAATALMYLNLPDASSLGPTNDVSWLTEPSVNVAMIAAFFLGLGDGCLQPQICAAIGVIWPTDPSAALAIFRFFQAASCAAGFFVSTLTGLYNQLIVFIIMTLIGTITFCANETSVRKRDAKKTKQIPQISVVKPKLSIIDLNSAIVISNSEKSV